MIKFSKNQVAGEQLEYYFYIEGILVPIQSFTIGINVNQPAVLHAEVAPFPEAITCLRKGMKVFLFKRTNKEQTPRLRFFGCITGHLYSKSYGNRTLKIGRTKKRVDLHNR